MSNLPPTHICPVCRSPNAYLDAGLHWPHHLGSHARSRSYYCPDCFQQFTFDPPTNQTMETFTQRDALLVIHEHVKETNGYDCEFTDLDTLEDLGYDSLDATELCMRLEERLHITIEADRMKHNPDLLTIARYCTVCEHDN